MVSRWVSYLPHLSQPEQLGNLCEGSNRYRGRSLRDCFLEDELWHPVLAHRNCSVWPLKYNLIKMNTECICIHRFSYQDTWPHNHDCTTAHQAACAGLPLLWTQHGAWQRCGTGLFHACMGCMFRFPFHLHTRVLPELRLVWFLFSLCLAAWEVDGRANCNGTAQLVWTLSFVVKSTQFSQGWSSIKVMNKNWFQSRALGSRIYPTLFLCLLPLRQVVNAAVRMIAMLWGYIWIAVGSVATIWFIIKILCQIVALLKKMTSTSVGTSSWIWFALSSHNSQSISACRNCPWTVVQITGQMNVPR